MWEVFTGSVAFDRQHYGEVFEVRARGGRGEGGGRDALSSCLYSLLLKGRGEARGSELTAGVHLKNPA